ncbi:MAG: hypothetical protein Q8927_10555 [Bacteroidota bacterium]|nr:hypothetical protein [Bacteroidota bacterium]
MAAKLDQVTVPDMADGIWAGIESQLDAGAGAGAPKGRGLRFGFIGMVTLVVFVAVCLLIWWRYPKQSLPAIKESPAPAASPSVTPPRATPPAADSHTILNKPKKKGLPVESVDSTIRQDAPPSSPPHERVDIPPARVGLSPVRVDSLPGRTFPLHIDSVHFHPPGKKSRGVSGITDDDYKISAKKDSALKKN